MSRMKRIFALAGCLACAALMALPAGALAAKTRLAFSGGPDGGTFQYFSNAISSRLSKQLPDVEVSNMASAGSVENLRRVNSGDADFGVVYAGDLFLGTTGQLTNDPRKYTNVLSLAYLYGAPAHLVVLADSGIESVKALEGKRVAVGPAGSGAAASAQRYFTSLGLWDKMNVEYIGYSEAASSIGDNPYYAEVTIPAGTYSGVDYDVQTVQDSTIWVAGKHVKEDVAYNSLKEIFSPEGLTFMVGVTKAAAAMKVEDGNYGIVTPLHTAAAKFWQEKGLTLTDAQLAK